MKTAKQFYQRRRESFSKLRKKQEKTATNISNLRLVVFIIGALAGLFMVITRSYMLFAVILFLCIVFFVYLVIHHEKLLRRMKYTALLCEINDRSLKRLDGEWGSFADHGEEFLEDNHAYAGDLDIFGHNSLFQWINTANTYIGRLKLRDLLAGAIGSIDDLHERQEAVDELAGKLNWRQRFEAEGRVAEVKLKDPETLIKWGAEAHGFFTKTWVIVILRVCPVITTLLVLLGLVMDRIPWQYPAAALLLQGAMLFYKSGERQRSFLVLENYHKDLSAYYKMLKLLETQHFNAAHIINIKAELQSLEHHKAYRQLDRLSSIVDSIANRRNFFYFIFNILTLWDLQSVIALECWKAKSGQLLKSWFDALGSVEALASLAVIRFDHPNWAKPIVSAETEAMLEAKAMGHPFLGENRILNDLYANESKRVLLITGSNMSGKSTLLRTAGINLVLAYAGAPVCASEFQATVMELYTCMRTQDNLEESISSFYAELLRIKRIVSEVDAGKRIFFLLDEIFKGTNSEDRHTGAKVLITKLSKTNSIGLVSTHDLELCELEQPNNKITNYHFQEYYEAGKIRFDYKLRIGPSTTRNALHLMRLVGLEVEEQ